MKTPLAAILVLAAVITIWNLVPSVYAFGNAGQDRAYLPVLLVPPKAPTATGTPVSTAAPSPTQTATSTLVGTHTGTPTVTTMPSSTPTWTPTATTTLTATPTRTPLPACSSVQQVLRNPSYEQPFTSDPTQGWFNAGGTSRVTTYSTDGSYSAKFLGSNSSTSGLGQMVFVPSWAEYGVLSFSWLMFSSDTTAEWKDYLDVSLASVNPLDFPVPLYHLHNTDVRGSWQHVQVPIGTDQIKGRAIAFGFDAYSDQTYPTTWYLDQVKLTFSCGSPPP